MLEMRRSVTHADRVGHADPLEFLALERDDVDLVGRRIEMQLQVDQRRGCVFDRRPALIEPARFEELVDDRVGHRLAGLIVEREASQHFWLQDPMLEDLGGKLDEVAGDMGAGDTRIDDVRQHAVQAMAEFMKERTRVVDAQKTCLAIAALGEVHHVDDDWQLWSVQLLLTAETAHPRPAAL